MSEPSTFELVGLFIGIVGFATQAFLIGMEVGDRQGRKAELRKRLRKDWSVTVNPKAPK